MHDNEHFITARQFHNIQKRIARQLALPLDAFEEFPDGWNKYPIDPLPVEDGLRYLRLREGFALRAYQLKGGGNGNGFVYALPSDSKFLDPSESPTTKSVVNGLAFEAPSPPDALSCFMLAFAGNRSPRSFFEASVLVREMGELGAMWHGGGWRTHTVIDAEPFALHGKTQRGVFREIDTPVDEFTWISGKPSDWRPKVEMQNDAATVQFYSFSGLGRECLYVHTDTYSMGSYVPKRSIDELAHGRSGYVF